MADSNGIRCVLDIEDCVFGALFDIEDSDRKLNGFRRLPEAPHMNIRGPRGPHPEGGCTARQCRAMSTRRGSQTLGLACT
jgi:hypothetical protein